MSQCSRTLSLNFEIMWCADVVAVSNALPMVPELPTCDSTTQLHSADPRSRHGSLILPGTIDLRSEPPPSVCEDTSSVIRAADDPLFDPGWRTHFASFRAAPAGGLATPCASAAGRPGLVDLRMARTGQRAAASGPVRRGDHPRSVRQA
jgi:hypothetical protein